ncbi:MAG TPA: glutaredoxin [Leucothrix mucor]|uniref:Glutaredoxin n=1 Tax=Leucothrix mucor TaxID=45248 RepID=A0A7V2T0T3_LEUMU|nr:glutaredoxin [Leucothrix mucor]
MTINVDVFSSPGCGKCGHAKKVLQELAIELGEDKINWREVNILEDIDYAVDLGVLSTPSIAIDGVLIFKSLPSPHRLRKELLDHLKRDCPC